MKPQAGPLLGDIPRPATEQSIPDRHQGLWDRTGREGRPSPGQRATSWWGQGAGGPRDPIEGSQVGQLEEEDLRTPATLPHKPDGIYLGESGSNVYSYC